MRMMMKPTRDAGKARIAAKGVGAVAILLALSACERVDDPQGEVSTQEALAQAQELTKPRPGQYETQFELVDLTLPGVPEAQVGTMREMFAANVQNRETSCMTQADAEKGFEEMVRQLGESNGDAQCTIDRFTAVGGMLDAALSCAPKAGVTASMTVKGDIAPERSVMTMAINTKADTIPGGEMTMSIKTTANRIGDCQT